MKYKSLVVGMQCLVATQVFAYTDFINSVDKYSWISAERKKVYRMSPPFLEYAKSITEQMHNAVQDEDAIDVEKAKSKAVAFYEKYLTQMPELLSIAKDIIGNGKYSYGRNIYGSRMRVILGDKSSWSEGTQELLFDDNGNAKEHAEDEVEYHLDKILSGEFGEEVTVDKLKVEIANRYNDKDSISKNFGIEVHYSNERELPVQIIHETAHVLDVAYRIMRNIYSKTVICNKETVSIFFETLARREFGIELVDRARLAAVYREMIQHDYLQRVLNNNGRSITEITDEVRADWKSPLDEYINYIDFDEHETGEAIKKIQANECVNAVPSDEDYFKNVAQALEFVNAGNITETTVEKKLKHMVTVDTPALTSEGYGEILRACGTIAM